MIGLYLNLTCMSNHNKLIAILAVDMIYKI